MVNTMTLSLRQINALQPLKPPTSLLPPPHSTDQVCSSTLPSSYSLWPIHVSVHASLMAMVNQTVIICLYLPHSSLFLTPHLPHMQTVTAQCGTPLSVSPGLRWQSFKDHTSRTHTALPQCMSIHTWEGDYTSPPRQLQITINGDANHQSRFGAASKSLLYVGSLLICFEYCTMLAPDSQCVKASRATKLSIGSGMSD